MPYVGASMVGQYIQAEFSLLGGALHADAVQARLDLCKACPHLDSKNIATHQVGYCRACNCPRWSRAELTLKATMPAATCPHKLWPTQSA